MSDNDVEQIEIMAVESDGLLYWGAQSVIDDIRLEARRHALAAGEALCEDDNELATACAAAAEVLRRLADSYDLLALDIVNSADFFAEPQDG